MKNLKLALLVVTTILVSCGKKVSLSTDMLENNNGYEALKEEVYKKFPNLEKEGIELMEYRFSESVSGLGEMTSTMSFTMVKGDDKNAMISILLDNKGGSFSNLVDITTGSTGNRKKVKSYDAFKPVLFSEKDINLDVLRQIRTTSIEKYKKSTNSETAICESLSIEKEGKTPKIRVSITEKKLSSTLTRVYYYTLDGKETSQY